MLRRVRFLLAAAPAVLAALDVPATQAVVIDNFESGGFSMSLALPGENAAIQFPNAGHCIDNSRYVLMHRFAGPTGSFTADLVPLQNVDDGINVTFPVDFGGGDITLRYSGGLWNLTDDGSHNHVAIRASGGETGTVIGLFLEDNAGHQNWIYQDMVGGDAVYRFAFSSYGSLDETNVTLIEVFVQGVSGEEVILYDVSTSNQSKYGITYEVWQPNFYTWSCGPRGGGAGAVGWNWKLPISGSPTIAGPQLQIQGVGGDNCQGVQFDSYGSGEVGLISVDWQAPTFDSGMFDLRFVTDPGAGYVATPVGDPVVEQFNNGFRITHVTHFADLLGIPDGEVTQQLIVSAVPGQEIWLDYVDVQPVGNGTEVGYSLSFGYTASLFDPGLPLLEIYANGNYGDDGGTTGIEVAAAAEGPTAGLRALPSVTRTSTRFVLGEPSPGPVTLDLFDVSGRLVQSLVARNGQALWDGRRADGVRATTGVYFGRVRGAKESARVVILR